MANFPQLKMTNAGRNLQAKAQTGQALKFTRVGLGDGVLSSALEALTGLVAEKQSLSIRDQKTPGDGTSILQVIGTNKGVLVGFYIRELGLFALDPDTGAEVLYSYTNAAAESDFLPAEGHAVTWEGLFDLVTVVGNAANVTAVIDDYITIALKSEVAALKPYTLPTGGTAGQLLVKDTNEEGRAKWESVDIDGLDLRLTSIEEPRVAVANQRTFTLQKTVTNGLAVYIGSIDADGVPSKTLSRLPREQWTPLSATQLQLAEPLAVKTPVLFVNNEEAGAGESLSVSIEGPTLVYPGSTNTFTIGAFDSFSVYAQAASKGTLTRSGKTLTLVIASGEAAGTLDLDVTRDNVKVTRRIAIGAAAIAKPQILTPAPGATGVGFEPDLTIAPFVVYPAGYDTLRKTRWQIALDAAFTQFVYNAESTVNLTAINLGSVGVRLEPSKQYFVRAECSGDTLVSAMSDTVTFNTAAIYIRRPAITAPVDGQLEVSPSDRLVSDVFSVYGGADKHQASRWQYSTVPDFSTVFIDSGWVTDQLTSYLPVSVVPNKTEIYSRVKYRGEVLGESEWSPGVRYVTADSLKGTYTSKGTGASARYYTSGAVINGKIYISGGIPAPSPVPYGDIWEYDIAAKTWQQKVNGHYAYCHTSVVYQGRMYNYGGSNDGSYPTSVGVYNPANNTFGYLGVAAGSPVPSGRWQHAAVVIAGKMYVCGGGNSSTSFRDLWAFDLVTTRWVQLTAPPIALGGCGVEVNGKMYVFFNGLVYVYDPVSDAWSTKKAGPKFEFSQGVLIDSKIYFFGGTNQYSNTLWFYDVSADVWQTLASGASARNGHVAVAVDRKMYIWAGHYNGNANNSLWLIE